MINPIDWIIGLGIIGILVLIFGIIILALVLGTIFLKIALSFFDSRNDEFGSVFVTALIMALVGWIPCIGCILSWVIINSRHKTGFGTAIVVWLLSGLLAIIVAFLIVIFLIFPLLGLASIIPP